MTTDNRTAIRDMMAAFRLNYTGFKIDQPVDPQTNKRLPSLKSKLWRNMLADFDAKTIEAATLQIMATHKNAYNWAPDIATVSEQCLNIQTGMLSTPTGYDAWERVMDKVNRKDIELTDPENQALKQTGLTIGEIRTVNLSSIPTIRSQFVSAFDRLINKQLVDALTPKSVKQLIAQNAPQLPAPQSKQLLKTEPEPEYEDPAKVKALVRGLVNGIGDVR